jgi:hypothetical protein
VLGATCRWDLLAHVPTGLVLQDGSAHLDAGKRFSIDENQAKAVLHKFLRDLPTAAW